MDRGVESEDMLFGVLKRRAESRNFPREFYFMAEAVLGQSGASRAGSRGLDFFFYQNY